MKKLLIVGMAVLGMAVLGSATLTAAPASSSSKSAIVTLGQKSEDCGFIAKLYRSIVKGLVVILN